jgi:hypothetical protein
MADERLASPDLKLGVIGKGNQLAALHFFQLVRRIDSHGFLEHADDVPARMNLLGFTIHGDCDQVWMTMPVMATALLNLDEHQRDVLRRDLFDYFNDLF